MADHFEVVKDAPGFGSRLVDSIKGILFGFLIFVAAFPLLWWGENRQNLADFVKNAVLIESKAPPSVAPNTLIKTTGKIHSDESANDSKYLAAPAGAKFLKVSREAEMYAWDEDKKTEKRGDKEVTTYDYKKEWTGSPSDSSGFYEPSNHSNPPMSERDETFQVGTATIGALSFEAEKTDLHGSKDLNVTEAMLNIESPSVLQVAGGKIYIPYGVTKGMTNIHSASKTPEVGDLRLSFGFFPNDVEGSVVGDWDGGRISPHPYGETDTYLGAFPGGLAEFQAKLASEHRMMTWIIRGVALLMLWMGLNLILGPILTIVESIPLVGGAGKGLISLVTGAIAFVLWILTILLANLWLILLALLVIVAAVLFYTKKGKKPAPVSA